MERKKSGTAIWAICGILLVILIGCLAYILITQYNDYKSNNPDSAEVTTSADVTVPPTEAPTTQPTTEPTTQPIDDPAFDEEQARTVYQAANSAFTEMSAAGTLLLGDEDEYFSGSDASGLGFETAQKLGTSFDASAITVVANSNGIVWISYNEHIYTANGEFIG